MADQSESDRNALALYEAIKTEMEATNIAMRPMLADDPRTGSPNYDLTKADKDCQRCGGLGYRTKVLNLPDGELQTATIICRCVMKGGGVNLAALKTGRGGHVGRA